jgi:hypothetical protein
VIEPHRLIGMSFRLGGDPERHGATDCLGLARAVLAYQGIATPPPQRNWYRRLRRGDTSVFSEELQRWGVKVAEPRLGGTVALCRSDFGLGLAVLYEAGWLGFAQTTVQWSPPGALVIVDLYSHLKSSCATSLTSPQRNTSTSSS